MKVSVWEVMCDERSAVEIIEDDGQVIKAVRPDDALSPPHLLYTPTEGTVCFESACVEHDGTVRVEVMPFGDRDKLLIRELADGVICVRIGDTEISIEPEWRAAEMRVQRASGVECR